jgi:DNA uptake protein ComE-like DNA-binding protein
VDVKTKQKENTQNTLAQNIPADTTNKASGATPTHLPEPKVYPRKLSGDETIDINTSDSALLCRVPGIGPYFSRQIVRYRNKLGGYISTDQLLQIENFPTEALAWLVVSDSVSIKRLNINKLSIRQLMKHPYIGYYRASAIVDDRRVHGPITNIHVLRNLSHFSEEDIERLKPYIDSPITENSDSLKIK